MTCLRYYQSRVRINNPAGASRRGPDARLASWFQRRGRTVASVRDKPQIDVGSLAAVRGTDNRTSPTIERVRSGETPVLKSIAGYFSIYPEEMLNSYQISKWQSHKP